MRARIRALLAMWAVAGLVIPAPASAQAPQEPSDCRPGPAEVPGADGRDAAALARRGRRARAREQRRHRGGALQPRARRRERPGRGGLLRPVPVLHAQQELDRHQGHERVQRRRDRQHQDRHLELRRAAAAAHGRHASASRSTTTSTTPTTVFSTFNPIYNSALHAQPDAAAAAELQDRQRAHADQGRQEEPRDLRRAVPPDGRSTRGDREGLLLRPALRDRQPRGRAEEPAARRRSCSTRTRSASRSARWRRSTW